MTNKHTFYSKYGVGQSVNFNSWDLPILRLLENTNYNILLHYTAKIENIKFKDNQFHYLCFIPDLGVTIWVREKDLSIFSISEIYRKFFPAKNRMKITIGFDLEEAKPYEKFEIEETETYRGFKFLIKGEEGDTYWVKGKLKEEKIFIKEEEESV